MDHQQQNFTNGPSDAQQNHHQQQHHQHQQHQPQLQQQLHHGSSTPVSHHHQQQQQQQALNPNSISGMNPQIMGQLMTNPALAAAAAASPLFPPSAFHTNPGAFMTLPEYYTSPAAIQNEQNAKGSTAAIASTVGINHTPQQVTSGQASVLGPTQPTTTSSQSQTQLSQQQQQQAVFAFPTGLQHTLLPYGAGLAQNGAVQLMAGATNSAHTVHQLAGNAASAQSMMNASNAAAAAAMMVHQSMAGSGGATTATDITDPSGNTTGKVGGKRKKELTMDERAQQNRDRNREHARSTRLRKKAYIHKLKELVEGLHAERTEEVRQRRVAIQHLAEMQNVRRAVIHSFLRFHAGYEKDERKWSTILEDGFWLKQPVTPYRCFRRSEIEQVSEMSMCCIVCVLQIEKTRILNLIWYSLAMLC
jgi:hypothetical protein